MSYNIYIGPEPFNYTSNLAEDRPTGFQSLHDLTGAEAAPLLNQALSNIRLVPDEKIQKKYNPPNGWGTVTGGVIFMARVMAACYENPKDTVEVNS